MFDSIPKLMTCLGLEPTIKQSGNYNITSNISNEEKILNNFCITYVNYIRRNDNVHYFL